jgi:hypothetical protein
MSSAIDLPREGYQAIRHVARDTTMSGCQLPLQTMMLGIRATPMS